MKRVAEPHGVYFLSLSFVLSFLSFRRCCCGVALVVLLHYGRHECNAQAFKYHSEACEDVSYCHGCQALATIGAQQARKSRHPRESEGFETPGVSVQGIRIQSLGVFKKASEYCKFFNLSHSLCVFLYVVSFLVFFRFYACRYSYMFFNLPRLKA